MFSLGGALRNFVSVPTYPLVKPCLHTPGKVKDHHLGKLQVKTFPRYEGSNRRVVDMASDSVPRNKASGIIYPGSNVEETLPPLQPDLPTY